MKTPAAFCKAAIFVSSLLVMIGCNSYPMEATPTQTVIATTEKPTTTATLPPSPTVTTLRTPTPTKPPTRTPLPTPTTSPTPLPTLPPDQAQAVILELLQTNGQCLLPCWWGLTPGVTSWGTARELLEPIASEISPPRGQPLFASVYFFGLPETVVSPYLKSDLTIQNNVITQIEVSGFDMSEYHLPKILETYGPPEEIWISAYRTAPEVSPLPFVLVLFYLQQGIMTAFSTTGELRGNSIRGCFENSPSLRLWEKKPELTFREAAKMFNWDVESAPYAQLTEVTDLNPETFHQKFQHAVDAPCVETPANLWP